MEKIEIVHDRVDEAISVMKEVARWGREMGLRLWPDEWLTKEKLIYEEARPYDFCLGTIKQKTVCAFILQEKDSGYWPFDVNDQAYYLHKLCVRREYAHQNITKRLVEAIIEEGRLCGKQYIRLDANLDEKVVRQIYLGAGFKIVKILDHDGHSTALYELEIH